MVVYLLKDPESLIVRYVGISSKTALHRFKMHLKDAKLKVRKGGFLSIKEKWLLSLNERGVKPIIITVAESLSNEEAEAKEIALIAHYKRISEGGTLYNIQEGGSYVSTYATPWNRGVKNCYSKEFLKNNQLNQPNRKPVYRFDLEGNLLDEWLSVRSMCDSTGLDRRTVMRCLKGEENFVSCHGFMFSFSKEAPVYHNRSRDLNRNKSPHAKAIKAIFPNGEEKHFQSIREASEMLHIHPSEISGNLHGKRSSTKHIKFIFE